jgi:hypothetical protein
MERYNKDLVFEEKYEEVRKSQGAYQALMGLRNDVIQISEEDLDSYGK